jgi:hypothetical protein
MSYQPETFEDLDQGSLDDFDLYLEDVEYEEDPWYDEYDLCSCGGDCLFCDDDPIDDGELLFIVIGEPDDDE